MKTLRMKNSSTGVKITIIGFTILFLANAIFNMYPVYMAIMNSFKTVKEYGESIVALPTEWHFENLLKPFSAFEDQVAYAPYGYWSLLGNTLWILVVNTLAELVASFIFAYALSKFRFPGSEFLYWLVILTQTIPIMGTGAAGYKLRMDLNMINNPYLIWLSWLSAFDFTFIIFYGVLKGVSKSYSEAAKIDGASNAYVMFNVIMPQVWPVVLANAITAAMNIWNNYSISMIYLRKYPTLAYGMYMLDYQGTGVYLIDGGRPTYFAAAIWSALPMICLYAASQNLILQNMSVGGLKG